LPHQFNPLVKVDFIYSFINQLFMKKNYALVVFALFSLGMLQTSAQQVASMDDLTLETESYWNGSDSSGSFSSGPMVFKNQYSASWSGFAYSNITNNTTPGYTNQYSAFAGIGALGSAKYAIGYNFGADTIIMNKPSDMLGLYVTNSTYAALSMRDGDEYSKKFGGETGNDEDWFKLKIIGWNESQIEVGIIEFYLADYRFADNVKDYIIKDWQWVDLSSLTNTSYLTFELSSTDNGDWGMNTPAYFCLDEITIKNFTDISFDTENDATKSEYEFQIYPNPAQNYLNVTGNNPINQLSIVNLAGQLVLQYEGNQSFNQTISIENLNAGIYFIQVISNNKTELYKISKQ